MWNQCCLFHGRLINLILLHFVLFVKKSTKYKGKKITKILLKTICKWCVIIFSFSLTETLIFQTVTERKQTCMEYFINQMILLNSNVFQEIQASLILFGSCNYFSTFWSVKIIYNNSFRCPKLFCDYPEIEDSSIVCTNINFSTLTCNVTYRRGPVTSYQY